MKRKPIVSSVLKSIGYSADTLVLEIEFVDQKDIYQYQGVTRDVYEKLIDASSRKIF